MGFIQRGVDRSFILSYKFGIYALFCTVAFTLGVLISVGYKLLG
jgi:hypothetical protein